MLQLLSKKKLFNDPIYGFITFPFDILYDIIEHPYFQRLRRISQQGLSHLVYPGAMHTRFHHALGALHLTCEAVNTLRSKNIDITDEEFEGVCLAILLHDIGHGPFSHALENNILPFHHEEMSLAIMEMLNVEFNGKLNLGIEIFKGNYHKSFLHELISGQIDMDRLDYLNRDSFFTGVAEGVVSYDRIITMLNVRDNRLVIEEKGIYSIEKFLVARRFMYWQVYLHKTGIAAEQMLIAFMKKLKNEYPKGGTEYISIPLMKLFELSEKKDNRITPELIESFCKVDDTDIVYTLKIQGDNSDKVLQYLSDSILNRVLFKVALQNEAITEEIIQNTRSQLLNN
ncbi:MAG: HD domain-containing protein, partial [Saprospiraceae bacterium]|nr:HD domain-containing protein [Saprospiraceae bacterium]